MGDLSGEILFEKFSIIECFKKDEHTGVYLADHVYLGKKIILKVLNTESIGDNEKIERFKREAKIMARLEHPNIIRVLDFGMYGKYFYISQEYFKGANLRQYINHNEFSAQQMRNIFIQFFSALYYAHRHDVIHRDIKPENIFLNESFDVKIGDFGLALSMSDNYVTGQFSIVGTPSYMSPEQISGDKLDERSDLFSGGIVMLELLTGKNPFMGKDINESINNIVNFDGIPDIGEVKYPEFIPVLEKLIRKEKSKRVATALEVLEELNPEGEENSTVYPPGDIYQNKKVSRRGIKLVVLILLFIITVGGYFILQKDEPEKEDNTPLIINTPIQKKQDTVQKINDSNLNDPPPDNETNATITKEPEKDEKETTPPADLFGYLDIKCMPWADVYINSEKVETTPLPEPVKLKTGKHTIKLVHPDYPEYTQVINVESDQYYNIEVNLDTLYGYANFNILPWGEIFIDGKSFGVTPFNEPVRLLPGDHEYQIKNPVFPVYSDKIIVSGNDTIIINYKFER